MTDALLTQLLRRVVVAWDSDESIEFMAAMAAARHHLGRKLADTEDVEAEAEVLVRNGYTAEGEPR